MEKSKQTAQKHVFRSLGPINILVINMCSEDGATSLVPCFFAWLLHAFLMGVFPSLISGACILRSSDSCTYLLLRNRTYIVHIRFAALATPVSAFLAFFLSLLSERWTSSQLSQESALLMLASCTTLVFKREGNEHSLVQQHY